MPLNYHTFLFTKLFYTFLLETFPNRLTDSCFRVNTKLVPVLRQRTLTNYYGQNKLSHQLLIVIVMIVSNSKFQTSGTI